MALHQQKYSVILLVSVQRHFTVEATSRDEAKRKARQLQAIFGDHKGTVEITCAAVKCLGFVPKGKNEECEDHHSKNRKSKRSKEADGIQGKSGRGSKDPGSR